MAISAHIKLHLLIALAALYPSLTWAACSDKFTRSLMVLDWEDEVPNSAILSTYKKGSNFEDPAESSSSDYFGEKLKTSSGRSYLRVVFKDQSVLSHKYDYRLIIDNKIDFKIYEITPSARRVSSCSLKSAKVNDCEADAYHWITFEKKCGKLLEN